MWQGYLSAWCWGWWSVRQAAAMSVIVWQSVPSWRVTATQSKLLYGPLNWRSKRLRLLHAKNNIVLLRPLLNAANGQDVRMR